jgi:hypothetical protein
MYIDGFMDISGGRLQTRSVTDGHLLIAGDSSLNNLEVHGDVSLNGNLYVGGDISWNPASLANDSIPSSAIIGGVVGATGPAGDNGVNANTDIMLLNATNHTETGNYGLVEMDYKMYGSTDLLASPQTKRFETSDKRGFCLLFKPGIYQVTLNFRFGGYSGNIYMQFDNDNDYQFQDEPTIISSTNVASFETQNSSFNFIIEHNANLYIMEHKSVLIYNYAHNYPQIKIERIGHTEPSGTDDTLSIISGWTLTNTITIEGGIYWNSSTSNPPASGYEPSNHTSQGGTNEWAVVEQAANNSQQVLAWVHRIDTNSTSSVEVASFHSDADLSLNKRLFVGEDVTLNKRLFVGEDVSLNGNLYVGGDISWNPNSLANDSIPSSAIIGGGGGSSVWTTNNSDTYFSGGNVGIGTSTPARLLHIHKSQGGGTLELSSTNTMMYLGTNDSTECYVWVDTDDDLKFGTNQTERLRIKNNGNVGIGTSSPDEALTIHDGNLQLGLGGPGWRIKPDSYAGFTQGGGYLWFQNKKNDTDTSWHSTGYIQGTSNYVYYNGGMMNFTGQHRTFIENISHKDISVNNIGLIVSSNKNTYIKMINGIVKGNEAITINESLPVVSKTTKRKDKSIFGVISNAEDHMNSTQRREQNGAWGTIFDKEEGDNRVYINSVGEGAIWVADTGGNLNAGDYITSSNIPGYGELQEDDILHNYTVAKITMDCDFNPVLQYKPEIKKKDITDASGNYQQVNDLNVNDEIQWVDSTIQEYAYNIRYVDASGTILTENEYNAKKTSGEAVFKAAFVGCTYHCG